MATIPSSRTGGGSPYEEVQASDEFAQLRSRFRRFVFPVTAGFLVWYFLFVLLSAYASSFMATKVIGTINIGLLFGLLQFVSTFAITIAYMRWADREFDPTADALRERIEGDLDGRGEGSLNGRGEGSPDGRGKGRLDARLEGRDLR